MSLPLKEEKASSERAEVSPASTMSQAEGGDYGLVAQPSVRETMVAPSHCIELRVTNPGFSLGEKLALN